MEEHHSKEHILNIEIYTDGSLKKIGMNNTFGGWAFIVIKDNKKFYYESGNEHGTTNQRMELKAISEALKVISTIRRPNEKVIVYSDSSYAINCYLQDWYIKWSYNGWKNASNQPVANQDLWTQIVPYFDDFWFDFQKVKGHNNVFWNERADALAQEAAENQKISWRGTNG